MLRRDLIRGMLPMVWGLGRPDPRRQPAPRAPSTVPGVGAGSGQLVRARQVIVFGPGGRILVYSGTPATGDLVAAIAGTAGTDPYGNGYGAGINSLNESTGASASLQSGLIGLFAGLNEIIALSQQGEFIYTSPYGTGNLAISLAPSAGTDAFANPFKAGITAYDTAAADYIQVLPGTPPTINISTGDPGEAVPGQVLNQVTVNSPTQHILSTTIRAPKVTGQAAGAFASVVLSGEFTDLSEPPDVAIEASNGTVTAQLAVTPAAVEVNDAPLQALAGTPTAPTRVSTDSWQSLGSPAIANVTVDEARYALMPFGVSGIDMMCIDVALTATGAMAAGVYTFANTLAAAYQFPGNYSRSYAVGFNGTITTATNNSDLLVDGAGTGSPGRVRLQVPALPVGTSITVTCFIPLN